MAKCLMVVGTASNVGKSVLCAAICRILQQDGYDVAPFKAQNMSLNSAVTPSGREIGRAQAVQAEACKIPANEHMNPVLLKPTRDNQCQIVLQGRVYMTKSARDYFVDRTGEIWEAVVESYHYLNLRHEVLVIEGAGSPVEMNLKPRDIANMRTAELADAAVLLVADIDRGGIFASVVGTMQLLSPNERARVKGIIVNKFRGDPTLFEDGIRLLESYSGVPVLGVIPYIRDHGIAEEDSVALDERYAQSRLHPPTEHGLRIAIVQLPHLSNFTDFAPLFLEPGVHPYFCQDPDKAVGAHAVIVPGTKNTMNDLEWLVQMEWDRQIQSLHERGVHLFGICGGYQMLGEQILDPHHEDSLTPERTGLRYLPVVTTMEEEKTTVQVSGEVVVDSLNCTVSGYEIHMGMTKTLPGYLPLTEIETIGGGLSSRRFDGAVSQDGTVVGTYLHGIFDNDVFRYKWLSRVRETFQLPVESTYTPLSDQRDGHYDRVAQIVRDHLDTSVLYEILGPARGAAEHPPVS